MKRKGSPPRMRGKGVIPAFCSESAGITPAYAGKRNAYGFKYVEA